MQKPVGFGMEQWYRRPCRIPERMMGKEKRAAVYLRVSTGEQTVDNQRRELEAAAASRGWSVMAVYADEGISGAKGREGADSDEAARVYRALSAHRSNLMAPTILI
jgi:predicted site-specific integrase-resolvase